MVRNLEAINISDVPELAHLVEEVRRSHQPRILRRDGEDIAMLVPIPEDGKKHRSRARKKSEADYEAFRRSAGGWKGLVDTDELIEDIYESRQSNLCHPES